MDLSVKRPPLLASDLDGTLIPPVRGHRHQRTIAAFCRHVERTAMPLLYVTGRHLELAERGIREFGLPVPDALACDVGTSLYRRDGDAFRPDAEYRERIASRPDVVGAEQVREALADAPGFVLQEEEKQGPFKVSFYVDPEAPAELLRELESRLDAGSRTRFVWSRDVVRDVGLLDVLPASVGKETAVRHVLQRRGWTEDDVIFAGDSGNDRHALVAGWKAIVVGNAPESLKEEVRSTAAKSGLADSIYFSDADVVAGVLEGLRHFQQR